MADDEDLKFKVGIGIWFCFCILIACWIFVRFLNCKNQMSADLHVVEDSLRKMSETLELERRKKSMGCVDSLDDISACLRELTKIEQTQENATEEVDGKRPPIAAENDADNLKKQEMVTEELEENKKDV